MWRSNRSPKSIGISEEAQDHKLGIRSIRAKDKARQLCLDPKPSQTVTLSFELYQIKR